MGWQGGQSPGTSADLRAEVLEVLKRLWQAAEQPCGKRLAALRQRWLPYYEQEYGKLPRQVRRRVLKVSAAQIDRLLKPCKAKAGVLGFDYDNGTRRATLHGFIRQFIEPGSTVVTDGLQAYRELEGYVHERQIQKQQSTDTEHLLPRVCIESFRCSNVG